VLILDACICFIQREKYFNSKNGRIPGPPFFAWFIAIAIIIGLFLIIVFIVLYVLYCIVLYCIVLYCIVLYVLYCMYVLLK